MLNYDRNGNSTDCGCLLLDRDNGRLNVFVCKFGVCVTPHAMWDHEFD